MTSENIQKLIETLHELPSDWVLTPVNGKKPYRGNWQKENFVERSVIAQEIKSGRATGYGLRTGLSKLLALDFDGHSALDKYLELSGGLEPDYTTVSWTSGKPGRFQLLFKVPEQFLNSEVALKNRVAVGTGIEKEQLEIRYTACQSVLPPSKHPDTGNTYRWINDPWTTEIAECPEFLIKLLVEKPENKAKSTKAIRTDKKISKTYQSIILLTFLIVLMPIKLML